MITLRGYILASAVCILKYTNDKLHSFSVNEVIKSYTCDLNSKFNFTLFENYTIISRYCYLAEVTKCWFVYTQYLATGIFILFW